MSLYIAADHRGFSLKETIKAKMGNLIDQGAHTLQTEDDYPDYAKAACQAINSPEDKAILICGSGHGMDIAANRFPHIRAIIGFNQEVVKQGRAHEDANVLVLASDWVDAQTALDYIHTFISTPFSKEERHRRRLQKLTTLTPKE
jgi:2-polyprenyl-6-hydroxyphenyl methylase/3-demethylubiquinone-9 3-methyltransferase